MCRWHRTVFEMTGELVEHRRGRLEDDTLAAISRMTFFRKFDQCAERRVPVDFRIFASRRPMADSDISREAVAIVDQAIGRKDR